MHEINGWCWNEGHHCSGITIPDPSAGAAIFLHPILEGLRGDFNHEQPHATMNKPHKSLVKDSLVGNCQVIPGKTPKSQEVEQLYRLTGSGPRRRVWRHRGRVCCRRPHGSCTQWTSSARWPCGTGPPRPRPVPNDTPRASSGQLCSASHSTEFLHNLCVSFRHSQHVGGCQLWVSRRKFSLSYLNPNTDTGPGHEERTGNSQNHHNTVISRL